MFKASAIIDDNVNEVIYVIGIRSEKLLVL